MLLPLLLLLLVVVLGLVMHVLAALMQKQWYSREHEMMGVAAKLLLVLLVPSKHLHTSPYY